MTKWLAVILGMGLLVAGVQPALAADAGSVSGKVTLKGTAPAPEKIAISIDPEKCGTEQLSEEVVVGAGNGLQNAVVRLVGVPGATADATQPATIEQKGCKFHPHVVVMPKGGSLNILNSDGLLHNLHSHSEANPPFNKAQPGFRKKLAQKFREAEIVKLTCDVHTWMNSYIVVAETPFVAVTDETGAFKLDGVPAGTYKLEVWHEKLGTETQDVTVKAAADASVTFELAGS